MELPELSILVVVVAVAAAQVALQVPVDPVMFQ
jgi:hypothetical protein